MFAKLLEPLSPLYLTMFASQGWDLSNMFVHYDGEFKSVRFFHECPIPSQP